MICAWIETSRAETGSSAMISFGSSASARATPIRCRWPPENSCGKRLMCSAESPTRSSRSWTRRLSSSPDGDPVQLQRVADDLADALARVQRRVGVLEDHLHLAPQRAQLAATELGQLGAAEARPSPRSASAAAGSSAPGSTCRSPTRRPGRASRPRRPRTRRRRRPARRRPGGRSEIPDLIGKCLTRSRDLEQRARSPSAVRLRAPVAAVHWSLTRPAPRARCRPTPALAGSSSARRESQQRSRCPGQPPRCSSVGHLGAAAERVRAARPEVTALGRVDQRRRLSLDLRQARGARPVEAHDRARAGPRCRDAGARRRSGRGCPVSTTRPAYMTRTRSAMSATTPRSWVIRITASPRSSFSCFEQAQDLRLDRDVERRGRLVGDQHRRLQRERPSRSSRAGACRPRTRAGSRRRAPRRPGCRPPSAARSRGSCASALVRSRWARICSTIWSPTW